LFPRLHTHFQTLAAKYKMVGPYLEIGAAGGDLSILTGSYFKNRPDRYAINLRQASVGNGVTFIKCNSNDMRGTFADNQFRTVLSNAVLEHDRYFWRSLEEIRRVLAPGGILAIGAPGFIPREQTKATIAGIKEPMATITYEVHARPDYWRFSRQAFQYVICEGLELLECRVVGQIPRLVAVARKP
jgi:SAM-dependent methyltransferase